MTPRLITLRSGLSRELSILSEKVLILDKVDFYRIRSSSVLLLLSWRKLDRNQALTSGRELVNEGEVSEVDGFVGKYIWVSSA